MAKKLTTDLVLTGAAATDTMMITWNNDEYEITVRPLTNKEQSKATSIAQSGITMHGHGGKMQTRAGLDKVTQAAFQGDVFVVHTGMVEPSMTEKQLFESTLPVDKIAKRIREISGIPVGDDEEGASDTGVTDFNEGAEFRDDEDSGE